MGLNDLVSQDLDKILKEQFEAYNRARACMSSYDPYLLGEDRFINYKLCLNAAILDNSDLSVGDEVYFARQWWRIVHIERMRVILKIFLQESGGNYA